MHHWTGDKEGIHREQTSSESYECGDGRRLELFSSWGRGWLWPLEVSDLIAGGCGKRDREPPRWTSGQDPEKADTAKKWYHWKGQWNTPSYIHGDSKKEGSFHMTLGERENNSILNIHSLKSYFFQRFPVQIHPTCVVLWASGRLLTVGISQCWRWRHGFSPWVGKDSERAW